ncbi:MAG TPA: FAD-binding oxidoreductase [Ktedonobacterales bacterium]|nr:FAD-binding oxidoreductase [Ktedonobacterales bacterium]
MQRPEGDSLSFWQDDAQIAPRYSALEGRTHTDMVVIGGGITGAACALWLARDGRRVLLLERETVAHGASGRNGGFLLAGTVETYDRAIALYGHSRARRLYAFSVANNVMVRALIDELEARRWPTGYRHTGSLRLADTPDELVEVRAAARLLNEDGWATEVFDETRLPKRLRGHYMGGSYHPADGEVQPAKLVSGLARLAQEAGAILHEQTPVLSLTENNDGVVIETPAGAVHAQQAIIATNAWLDDLLHAQPDAAASDDDPPETPAQASSRVVTPTRGQMLATAPIEERLFDCPIYAHYGYQYWRQLQNGRLIVGGWRDLASDKDQRDPTQAPTDDVQQHLEGFVYQTLGLPASTAITHRWAGLMAFTPNSLPLLGRAPGKQHIFFCGGYTGHGNALAVRCARVVADLACGIANADADLFAPEQGSRQSRP